MKTKAYCFIVLCLKFHLKMIIALNPDKEQNFTPYTALIVFLNSWSALGCVSVQCSARKLLKFWDRDKNIYVSN